MNDSKSNIQHNNVAATLLVQTVSSKINNNNNHNSIVMLGAATSSAGRAATMKAVTATDTFDTNKTELKKKRTQHLLPTIRFELKLEEPSSEQFCEFNYNKLVVKTLKIIKKKSRSNKTAVSEAGSMEKNFQIINKSNLGILEDEFKLEKCKINELLSTFRKKVVLSKEEESNENNLQHLDAETMDNNDVSAANEPSDRDEANTDSDNNSGDVKPSKSKKKSSQYDFENNKYKLKDFNYLGQGYDEDDSFIDNSEAIDERVPADMAPKRGGFYINKGNLKMEKIEEKKSKHKQRRTPKKPSVVKKLISENEEESTDDDYNPNEPEEKGDEMEEDDADASVGNEATDEDELSDDDDDSSDSDSDSGSESDETDESDSSVDEPMDEVAKKKKTRSDTQGTSSQLNKKTSDNDSSCEIIEIVSSTTNSNCSIQKRKKRRFVNDDEELDEDDKNENDYLMGKENIENGVKPPLDLKQHVLNKINTPTAGTVSSLEGSVNKKKRKKEGPDALSNDTGSENNSNGLPAIKQPRNNQAINLIKQQQSRVPTPDPEKARAESAALDVENENTNNSNQMATNATAKQLVNTNNRRSLPADLNGQQMLLEGELAANISPNVKELIFQFLHLYFDNATKYQNLWTDELKSILLKIYKETLNLPQNDKSHVFNYIALKINKKKDSLMRHCRNLFHKELNTSQSLQQQQTQPPKTGESSTKQQLTQQSTKSSIQQPPTQLRSPLQQQQQQLTITAKDLSEELQNKLLAVEKHFHNFKHKNNNKLNDFLKLPVVIQLIHSIDNLTRVTVSVNNQTKKQTREFTLEFLSKTFEVTRDIVLRILNQIRTSHTENSIKEKLALLKKAIDEEMPKQLAKYKQAQEEFVRSKNLTESVGGTPQDGDKKKLNAPRKKFEWTPHIRELVLQLAHSKMNLYRSASRTPSAQLQSPMKTSDEDEQAKKNEYLKTFLSTNLINLWPENWMQMNVLLHMIHMKGIGGSGAGGHQSQNSALNQSANSSPIVKNQSAPNLQMVNTNPVVRNNGHATNFSNSSSTNNEQPNQTQTKNFVQNSSIINLASKNGRQIKLEHQSFDKTQSAAPNTPKSTTNSRPTTPSQNRNQSQTTANAAASNQISPQSQNTSASTSSHKQQTHQMSKQQTQHLSQMQNIQQFNNTNNTFISKASEQLIANNSRPLNVSKQSHHAMASPTSNNNINANIYEVAVSQFKAKQASGLNSPKPGAASLLCNSSSSPNQIKNKSPNSLISKQQQEIHQMLLQNFQMSNAIPNFALTALINATTSAASSALNPNTGYTKNPNNGS